MRKITQEMVSAFYNAESASKDNTRVIVDDTMVYMYLHGNQIASYDTINGAVTIWNGGWESTTTKERLNGVLRALDLGIRQVKGVWYLIGKDSKEYFNSGSLVGHY